MKRMIPAALVALGLVVLNIAARVIVEVTGQGDDPDAQFTIGLYATVGMALVTLAVTAVWGTRKPVDQLVSQLGAAVLVAVLVSVFVAPLAVGGNPFGGGAGWIFIQLLFFGGVCALGALLGYLIITIVALDYRSQNLRQVERHYGARAAARAAGGKQSKRKTGESGGAKSAKKKPAKKPAAKKTAVEDDKPEGDEKSADPADEDLKGRDEADAGAGVVDEEDETSHSSKP